MSNVKANTEKPKRDKYTWLLLIGEKGKFIWSLFLPLSALCALSSTPLSFSKRNGPNNRNSAYYRRDKLKTQNLKADGFLFLFKKSTAKA